jgi:hypothetical protein
MILRSLTLGLLGPLYPKEGPSSSRLFNSEEKEGEESMLPRLVTLGPLYPKEGPSSSSF